LSKILAESLDHVVVRSPNWVGDAVMAIPAVRELALTLKPKKLTMLARKPVGEVWSRFVFIDEVLEFPKENEAKVHQSLSMNAPDALVLYTNSFRSAWNGLKTGAKIKVGYAGNFRSLFLTNPVDAGFNIHMTDYYLKLLNLSDGKPDYSIDFPLLASEKNFADKIGDLKNAIGIPLGAKYGRAKCWPIENVKKLVAMIAERGENDIVIFGTESEKAVGDELKTIGGCIVKNLAGKTTIGEMASVMKRCKTIVANDSGPLHIASTVGVKVIALFGSTDPKSTSPKSGNVTVMKVSTECAPCFRRECDRDFACMKNIKAEDIFKEL